MSEAKVIACFANALGVSKEIITNNLTYNSIPEWDSIGHMSLIAALESEFDIMLDTDDIIDMSSVAKCKEILLQYGVKISHAA